MILISGAPGTGKSTLAKVLCAATGATLVCTDDYLEIPHDDRLGAIMEQIDDAWEANPEVVLVIEGCEVDRLIKHMLEGRLAKAHEEMLQGAVLLCTGFENAKPGCYGLAARARKYFELWPGEKYLVRGVQTSDS